MDSLVDVTFKIPKRHLLGLDVYAERIGVTRDKLLAGFVKDELNYVSLDKLDTPVDNEAVLKPRRGERGLVRYELRDAEEEDWE